jgi:hypothetical protein
MPQLDLLQTAASVADCVAAAPDQQDLHLSVVDLLSLLCTPCRLWLCERVNEQD